MISTATKAFWEAYQRLPEHLRNTARAKFALWAENQQHPILQFKRVSQTEPIWSVRITDDYRALGLREGENIEWLWIGPHTEYERLLARR